MGHRHVPVAALLIWAVDELIRGVNPFRRILGIVAVLYSAEAFMAIHNRWHFSWRSPFLIALRDLMLPAIYVDAWLMDDFVWRGNAMSVREEEHPST